MVTILYGLCYCLALVLAAIGISRAMDAVADGRRTWKERR